MKNALQLRLSQHLALTPQLQQSIRLLQLSTLELNQEIEQALADNPLLERDDDPLATPLRVAADGAIVSGTAGTNGTEAPGERGEDAPEGVDTASRDGASAEDGLLDWGAGGRAERDDDEGPLSWACTRPTLAEHLRSQLAVTTASPRDRALVELLIEALNEDGYLATPLDELLALCPREAGVELDDLTAALALLQSFDP
ncbi:MAG: RNA polymerase factor sigma-54, partial [Burkholderiaceae bacterium]|nr:RNA polymerase factor sigma-54 [Burkholderiaceae bacterium]